MYSTNLIFMCDDDYSNIRPALNYVDWAIWLGTFEKRNVAYDEVGKAKISTIFLGLDGGHGFHEKPLVFETMIFAEGLACDMTQIRSPTVEDALYAHEAAYMELQEVVVRA